MSSLRWPVRSKEIEDSAKLIYGCVIKAILIFIENDSRRKASLIGGAFLFVFFPFANRIRLKTSDLT
jgi:hypothetical protein